MNLWALQIDTPGWAESYFLFGGCHRNRQRARHGPPFHVEPVSRETCMPVRPANHLCACHGAAPPSQRQSAGFDRVQAAHSGIADCMEPPWLGLRTAWSRLSRTAPLPPSDPAGIARERHRLRRSSSVTVGFLFPGISITCDVPRETRLSALRKPQAFHTGSATTSRARHATDRCDDAWRPAGENSGLDGLASSSLCLEKASHGESFCRHRGPGQ